jgi:predicted phosphodiesterase
MVLFECHHERPTVPKLPDIYVVSDLHLDHGPFTWPQAALDADLIIVAGDLSDGVFDIDFLQKPGKPLVFVPGNHDFWSVDADRDMVDIYADMKRAAAGTQVHVLWNETVVIEGVRVIGTPLWTDFGGYHPNLVAAAWEMARDYRQTNARSWYANPDNLAKHRADKMATPYGGPDPALKGTLTPLVAYSLHQESVRFIEACLKEDFPGRTILATHMAPSYECLRESGTINVSMLDKQNWMQRVRGNRDMVRVACYASDLTWLFDKYPEQLDLAVHGHIHSTLDIVCGSTRVVSNPRGYYSGPLTKQDDMALFGYVPTLDDIARSQARFTLYPYWGDNYHFAPQHITRLQDGLVPPMALWVEGALPTLSKLRDEVRELAPFIKHRTKTLRDSVQESVSTRAAEFSTLIESVVNRMHRALQPRSHGGNQLFYCLTALGLPRLEHGLRPWFHDPFGRKTSPVTLVANLLLGMNAALESLPQVLHAAELARIRYSPRLQASVEMLLERGVNPVFIRTAPTDYWRLFHTDLGRIDVDGPRSEVDALSSAVDTIMTEGKVPRAVGVYVVCRGT